MYKTIRNLLPALLLILGTACNEDLTTTPATGNPLVLEHVYIGTPTKAEPYNPDFVNGSTLTATLTLNGVTSEGTYTYKDGAWVAHTHAYWQNTTEEHTVILRTTPEPKDPMPDAFTTDNWHEYDLLECSRTTKATTSFSLAHTRAQLCVTLKKGTGLTDEELAAATLSVNGTGMLKYNGSHCALLNPTTGITEIVIDINGSTYTYTDNIPLTAGTCTMLDLTLNKTGVSGISVSSEEWKDVTGSVTEDSEWTTHTGGSLDASALTGKVLITGTLSSADMSAINGAKNQIEELYITATVDNNAWQSFNMGSSTSLHTIHLAQFTQLWMVTFMNCKALTTVSLPKVTSIDGEAFSGCTALTTVYLPKLTNVSYSIFDGCSSLKDITLSKATIIGTSPSGQGAFADCPDLITLHLPDLTAEEFEADVEKYTSFGSVAWQHIYYSGGAWHSEW